MRRPQNASGTAPAYPMRPSLAAPRENKSNSECTLRRTALRPLTHINADERRRGDQSADVARPSVCGAVSRQSHRHRAQSGPPPPWTRPHAASQNPSGQCCFGARGERLRRRIVKFPDTCA
jgi:hypothetical protein